MTDKVTVTLIEWIAPDIDLLDSQHGLSVFNWTSATWVAVENDEYKYFDDSDD